jgi:hypothetical protein
MTSKLKQQKCEVASLETVIDTQRFLNSVQFFFQDVPDPRSKKTVRRREIITFPTQ